MKDLPPSSNAPREGELPPWEVNVAIPARFQADVWQKIAARQAEQPFWSRLIEQISLAMARPQFAAALILIAGISGSSLAQVKAHQANERSFRNLESQYVASVDPYAHLARMGKTP